MGVGNVIELGQQSHGLSPSCEKLVTVSPDPSLSLEALSFSKAGWVPWPVTPRPGHAACCCVGPWASPRGWDPPGLHRPHRAALSFCSLPGLLTTQWSVELLIRSWWVGWAGLLTAMAAELVCRLVPTEGRDSQFFSPGPYCLLAGLGLPLHLPVSQFRKFSDFYFILFYLFYFARWLFSVRSVHPGGALLWARASRRQRQQRWGGRRGIGKEGASFLAAELIQHHVMSRGAVPCQSPN